jgi:hypothetical protein
MNPTNSRSQITIQYSKILEQVMHSKPIIYKDQQFIFKFLNEERQNTIFQHYEHVLLLNKTRINTRKNSKTTMRVVIPSSNYSAF